MHFRISFPLMPCRVLGAIDAEEEREKIASLPEFLESQPGATALD